MACIEQNDSKEKPNLAEEGSDDRQSTSDQTLGTEDIWNSSLFRI